MDAWASVPSKKESFAAKMATAKENMKENLAKDNLARLGSNMKDVVQSTRDNVKEALPTARLDSAKDNLREKGMSAFSKALGTKTSDGVKPDIVGRQADTDEDGEGSDTDEDGE